jgi:hypothetical protein
MDNTYSDQDLFQKFSPGANVYYNGQLHHVFAKVAVK